MTLPIQDFAQAIAAHIARHDDPQRPTLWLALDGLQEATWRLTDREFFEVTNYMWREHRASAWRRATNNFNAAATTNGDDQ